MIKPVEEFSIFFHHFTDLIHSPKPVITVMGKNKVAISLSKLAFCFAPDLPLKKCIDAVLPISPSKSFI